MEFFLSDNKSATEWEKITSRIMKMKAGEYRITAEKIFPARSLDQNAYWWAVPVKIVAEHIGEDAKTADRLLRAACLSETILLPNGKAMEVIGEHKNLTTAEFTKLIDRARIWCKNELNIHIPAPNEIDDKALMEIDTRYNAMFY